MALRRHKQLMEDRNDKRRDDRKSWGTSDQASALLDEGMLPSKYPSLKWLVADRLNLHAFLITTAVASLRKPDAF